MTSQKRDKKGYTLTKYLLIGSGSILAIYGLHLFLKRNSREISSTTKKSKVGDIKKFRHDGSDINKPGKNVLRQKSQKSVRFMANRRANNEQGMESKEPLRTDRFDVEEKIPDWLKDHTFIHLKGFASGLRFSSEDEMQTAVHKPFLEYVVEQLEKTERPCLCWDGDNYGKDSFVMLIPMIAEMYQENTGANLQILAFKLEQELEKFQRTWRKCDAQVNGTVVAVKGTSWKEVWPSAIEQTKGEHIICYGGGATTLTEFENYKKNKKWKVFLTSRDKGDNKEECHLKIFQKAPQREIEFVCCKQESHCLEI